MPSWWPMDMTWGGLPLSVPPGYIAYFVLPAVIAVSVGRWLIAAHGWRAPQTLLATGFVTGRSEEHTSELQSLMRISYAVFCLKKKKKQNNNNRCTTTHH